MRATADEALRQRDEEARRIAQREFTRPLALEAGAGTGKTAILVSRLVVWALGPGWERAVARRDEAGRAESGAGEQRAVAVEVLSRVAAITFTEAAAAEMAARVAEALAALADGSVPERIDAQALLADLEERGARARALFAALDHLSVQTIHAWCRGLLARHPIEAGLHPRFEVDADGRAQAEMIREVLEEQLHDAYASDAETPLFALAVEGYGPVQVEETLAALCERGATSDAFTDDPFSPRRIAAYLSDLRDALRGLEAAHGGSLDATHPRSVTTHDGLAALSTLSERLAAPVEDADALEALAKRAEPDVEVALKVLDRWVSTGKTGGLNKSEIDVFAGDVAELQDRAALLRARLRSLARLHPTRLEAARHGLRQLLREIERRVRAAGIVSYTALLGETCRLLRERADVCGKIRREIDQLLVDEFQDTDATQCEIVRLLALTGPASERPTLFLVGDPKQSIYGWRNADLAAYESFLGELEAAGGFCQRLSVNFRSAPAILDEVERTMGPVMRPVPGLQPEFQPLVVCEERARDTGFVADAAPVEHWVTWDCETGGVEPKPSARRAAEIEAEGLARDLARLGREQGVAWSQVGVLMRSGGDLEIYLSALRRFGIPYAVERDRSYYQRREVIEVAALVRCILDPLDHLALLTVLRSSWVGVPDAALVPLWSRGLPASCSRLYGCDRAGLDALRVAVAEVAADLPEGVPGLERVAGWDANLLAALEALSTLREDFDRESPDVFVERMRDVSFLEIGEAGRYLGLFRAANLDRFFRELEEELCRGRDGQALLRRLRSRVREGFEAEEERPKGAVEDVVRVMTIHMAKGLDFEHVYLVQLHKESGGTGREPIEIGEGPAGWEYSLFDVGTLGAEALAAQRRSVEAAERVRTLYVAMTRAKHRLVLLCRWAQAPVPRPFERCRSHGDLLASRDPMLDSLEDRMAELAIAREGRGVDAAGARWRLPAAEARVALPDPGTAEVALATTAARVAEDAERIAGQRAEARRRMARRWRRSASEPSPAEACEALAERLADALPWERAARAGAEHAAAAGTVIHRILEDLDFAAPIEEELARGRARVPALVGGLVAPGERAAVQERVAALLDRIEAGTWPMRLAALADRVVARELPVFLPAEDADADDAPVGFTAGTIDLLYRDAATDEWVVADYKTDRVESEADLAERTRKHAAQGAVYIRAVREALGLEREPRFELWYLWADRIEVAEAGG